MPKETKQNYEKFKEIKLDYKLYISLFPKGFLYEKWVLKWTLASKLNS